MAEGDLHGAAPQLLAFRRREFIQARTIFLHDQRAGSFLFNVLFHCFQGL